MRDFVWARWRRRGLGALALTLSLLLSPALAQQAAEPHDHSQHGAPPADHSQHKMPPEDHSQHKMTPEDRKQLAETRAQQAKAAGTAQMLQEAQVEELAATIDAHPDWLRYAWLGMAKHKAKGGDFHGAYDLTQRFGEPAAMPRTAGGGSLQELQARYSGNPDNITAGYALYQAQVQAGRLDDALNTARHFSDRASSPAYFHLLEAQIWATKQNWERAWMAWLAYRDAVTKK